MTPEVVVALAQAEKRIGLLEHILGRACGPCMNVPVGGSKPCGRCWTCQVCEVLGREQTVVKEPRQRGPRLSAGNEGSEGVA